MTARHIDPLRARFAVATLLLLLAAAAALIFGHVFDSANGNSGTSTTSVSYVSAQTTTHSTLDERSDPSQIEGALIAAGCAALALVVLMLLIVVLRTSWDEWAGRPVAERSGSAQRAIRMGSTRQGLSLLGIIRV